VRALAHPLRLRMLESLTDGPATAPMLARELGESSGATSYHLEQQTVRRRGVGRVSVRWTSELSRDRVPMASPVPYRPSRELKASLSEFAS